MNSTPAPRRDYQEGAEHGIAPAAKLGETGFAPRSMAELQQVAQLAVQGGYAPRGTTVQGAMLAIAKGMEVGLSPLYALQNIAVINGKPSIYGDGLIGLVHRSGKMVHFREYIEGDGDDACGVCEVQREGFPVHVSRFSVADAKQAGLWGRTDVWKKYWKRMLTHRARDYGLRDQFADVLGGLVSQEEATDYTPPKEAPRDAEVVDDADPFTAGEHGKTTFIDPPPEDPSVAEAKRNIEAAVHPDDADKYARLEW